MGGFTHYETLGLEPEATQLDIKSAFTRLIKKAHPDKNLASLESDNGHLVSITSEDEARTVSQAHVLLEAFRTLSDPTERAKYDKALYVDSARKENKPTAQNRVLDLSELAFDEVSEQYSCPCRCGDTYILPMSTLEDAAEHGVVLLACSGCSQRISVEFEVEEADAA